MAKQRFAKDFAVVANVLHEMNDLCMLDFDGQHAYQLPLRRVGQPVLMKDDRRRQASPTGIV